MTEPTPPETPGNELALRPESALAVAAPEALPVVAPEPPRAQVTFFDDRAEVTRRLRFSLEGGAVQLNLQGVSALLDDRSLRAQARPLQGAGVVEVRAARVRRQVAPREEAEGGDHARESRRAIAAAQRAGAVAQRGQAEAERLLGAYLGALAACPPGVRKPEVQHEWKEAYTTLMGALRHSFESWSASARDLFMAEVGRLRAEESAREARRRPPSVSANVEVELIALTPSEIELELSYRVPCALWRTEHLARLFIDPIRPARGELELITYALAWQKTGERWDNVAAVFSTAKPARPATAPLLREDLLVARRRLDDAAPEPPPLLPARPEELPGVNDGAPLSFEAPSPQTFPPHGRAVRVELARVRIPCEVSRLLAPEQKTAAYLRATAINTGATPILAGPVRVALGSGLLGRSKIGLVPSGESFSLGFGPDPEVRARRRVQDQREIVPVVGVQRLRRAVEIYLSNLADEARAVEVVERLPLGEADLVEVLVTDLGGAQLDTRTGLARYQVILAPKHTQRLTLSYEVRAAPRVRLNL